MTLGDTIAAIATPLGIGGIGVIRLSGDDAVTIASTFVPKPFKFKPNTIRYTSLISPVSKEFIDDGCIAYFQSPHSYTGENVVEFHLHGSVYILKKLLKELVEAGARPADPGEFTRRAFVAGKLDLTKAESVIDMIHSRSEKAHAVAINHLKGGLLRQIDAIRLPLMRVLEQVEGSIDFPDEVDPIDRQETKRLLKNIQSTLTQTLHLKDFGRWISSGINCVIIGKPNAGKSSLMNQLAGESRAIVSSIPGTTRDFIEVNIELGGILFQLIDTAGIRETKDPIELLGVKRVKKLMTAADLIIWVIDHTQRLTQSDTEIIKKIHKKKHVIIILNKSDRPGKIQLDALPDFPKLRISAKTGTGIDAFKTYLTETFVSQVNAANLDLICNIRQQAALKIVLDHVNDLIDGMDIAPNDDLFAFDLREAVMRLGELTGDTFNETVLDGIFSRFCVGK